VKSYEEALEIDFNKLEENWKDHSKDFMFWAEKWANAVADKDKLKEHLKVRTAEKEKEIRYEFARNPPKGMKVTEGLINSTLATDEDLIKLRNEVIDAHRDVDLFSSAKAAFEARKQALTGLTSLWIGSYYSTPNAPKEYKEGANDVVGKKRNEEHRKTINKGNARLKRRKKNE